MPEDGAAADQSHDPTEEPSCLGANGVLEGYYRGSLEPAAEIRFEEHLLECESCQEELKFERSFARGLKTAVAEDAVRASAAAGLLSWLARRRARTGLIAASLVLLALIGFGTGQLVRQTQRLEARLAELGSTTAPVQVPVVLLGVLRGGSDMSEVKNSGSPWSLAVDIGSDPRFTSYGVTITNADGELVFERDDLVANDLEVVQLTFPSGYLVAGEYHLESTGALVDGSRLDIGSYPFRMAP